MHPDFASLYITAIAIVTFDAVKLEMLFIGLVVVEDQIHACPCAVYTGNAQMVSGRVAIQIPQEN